MGARIRCVERVVTCLPSSKDRDQLEKGKLSRYRGNAASGVTLPTWADVQAHTIAAFVTAATSAGDMVSFGRAAEGSELMVTIISAGVMDKMFFKDAEHALRELNAMTDNLVEYIGKAGSVQEKAALAGSD